MYKAFDDEDFSLREKANNFSASKSGSKTKPSAASTQAESIFKVDYVFIPLQPLPHGGKKRYLGVKSENAFEHQ
jgi:hypothetical protein